MALLMFRTFGVIIVSFIVLIMYVLHRKKNGKFIKRKAVNEEEKIKYQKWEKIINAVADMQKNGINARFCVLETLEEAKAFAEKMGIEKVQIIG